MSEREAFGRQVRIVLASDADVPSPCMSVCRMDAQNRVCEGCLRTLDEIAEWSVLDEGERREVWRRIGERIAQETA